MYRRIITVCLLLVCAADSLAGAADVVKTDIATVTVKQQYQAVRPGTVSALALNFELTQGWHFYASADTAPGGMNLKIKPVAEGYISFAEPLFPRSHRYFDKSSGKTLEVFSNKFTVFLPFSVAASVPEGVAETTVDVRVGIEGAVCSDVQCRMPDFGRLTTDVRITPQAPMTQPEFQLGDQTQSQLPARPSLGGQWMDYSVWFALVLAVLAGLSLNIMPCVWPILPIIIMRIVQQAERRKSRSVMMGLTFCLGILLFFACLAFANIVLQVFYGTVLQWGDQFRNPAFVAVMALLLVVLAVFCFGLFTFTVPSSIAAKSASGKGYAAAVGMGFLAAILSTPCSFAILAAAFAWAQAQTLYLGTLAIMFIGVGMALPYGILTSMPQLLNRLPRAGRWMELFKQAVGFILLVIAIKLISALPAERRMSVLYFAVALGFGVWMWGTWVDYNTRFLRRWLVRVGAVVLVVTAGWALLPAPADEAIDWQPYDADVIAKAMDDNKPVLIKFTADWCLSCQVVEKNVYGRDDIAELIKQKSVLAVKADTTVKDYPATLALKNVYNEPGVPVTILFLPGTKEPLRYRNIFFGGELKESLEKIP
ncbi:MAG TPA: cytochrome c biogenesis protein CcdA [Sedimentisphaerales bacterium]|nr:cytochrome c biogenesis protein CcdA [Sedimentisphaerales bacterium]